MKHSAQDRLIDTAACLRYIIDRQTGEGGFCFYRAYGVEEPNGVDTYSAVASLCSLQAEIPDADELLAWLRRLQDNHGGYPNLSMAWYALETLRLLDAKPWLDPGAYLYIEYERFRALDWRRRALDSSSVLLSISRLSALGRHWGIAPPPTFRDDVAAMLDAFRGQRGGYGHPAENLVDTYRAVLIMHLLDIERPAGVLKFAGTCGDAIFGFRLVPVGSATSLEVVHAGIGVFNQCGADLPWETVAAVRRYIASCQTSRGGFARTPGAIPTLADTWPALSSLQLLSGSALAG